jgi:hypothetical protein
LQVIDIVKRYHAHDPKSRALEDSLVQDWVRKLTGLPLASIWHVYDTQIERAGTWLLSLGDYVQAVNSHARVTSSLITQIQASGDGQ